jgi:hypothetical protein
MFEKMYRNKETLEKIYKKAMLEEIYEEIISRIDFGLKEIKNNELNIDSNALICKKIATNKA